MEWIKCIKDNFPDSKCLVLYLSPSFGGYTIEVGTGYFDNPEDYENGGQGWLDWNTDRKINVTHFMELPNIPFDKISLNQQEVSLSSEFELGIVPEKFIIKNKL